MLPLIFFSIISGAQTSNWVDRDQVDQIRKSLDFYYTDCGHYPDNLEILFEPPKKPLCHNEGGDPPLASNSTNRDTVSKLIYTPYGYQDYELSIRLFTTRAE